MRIALSFACLFCIILAACASRPRYTVLDRDTGDLSGYGKWDVPKVSVATHIPNYWSGRKDHADWKKRVRDAADFIGKETKRRLDALRSEGKPIRVQIKLTDLKPAKGWGGIGKAGDLIVQATFIDPASGEVLGRCQARNFPTADPFVDPTRYLVDIADVFASFVRDHSE